MSSRRVRCRLPSKQRWQHCSILTASVRCFGSSLRTDQRHGLGGARYVVGGHAERRDLARAALLHDVGKRHARLGVVGRVIASLLRLVGQVGTGRIATYLDHGALAATELSDAGTKGIVVEFARAHHDVRPGEISPDDWAILEAADQVRR